MPNLEVIGQLVSKIIAAEVETLMSYLPLAIGPMALGFCWLLRHVDADVAVDFEAILATGCFCRSGTKNGGRKRIIINTAITIGLLAFQAWSPNNRPLAAYFRDFSRFDPWNG